MNPVRVILRGVEAAVQMSERQAGVCQTLRGAAQANIGNRRKPCGKDTLFRRCQGDRKIIRQTNGPDFRDENNEKVSNIGFFAGSALDNGFGGAILLSMIAGIACVVYTSDNTNK